MSIQKTLLAVILTCMYTLCNAQTIFPDKLPLTSIKYKTDSNPNALYDIKTSEKKAFLFYDMKTDALAEVMYNGCKFVFDNSKISIFPIYFSGELTKKPTETFQSAIPTQIYRTPLKSIFTSFNLSEADFPLLVVYNEKNRFCGYARKVEKISEIDCDEIASRSQFLRLKILKEEKNNKLEPYANKPVFILGGILSDTIAKLITNQYGDFESQLPNLNQDYVIKVDEKTKEMKLVISTQSGKKIGDFYTTDHGFEFKLLQVDLVKLPDIQEEEDIELVFEDLKSKTPKEFIITENLFYQLGESTITASSKEVLDKMIKVLNAYPQFNVQVISHTDSQGEEATNLKLSVKRSESVITYLSLNGVKKERLKAQGKGETEIRNRCLNNIDCSDSEHEYNRRTEFKFTKK